MGFSADAPRSEDGYYYWDHDEQAWHPVPETAAEGAGGPHYDEHQAPHGEPVDTRPAEFEMSEIEVTDENGGTTLKEHSQIKFHFSITNHGGPCEQFSIHDRRDNGAESHGEASDHVDAGAKVGPIAHTFTEPFSVGAHTVEIWIEPGLPGYDRAEVSFDVTE